MDENHTVIDGSLLEGGGQILRIAASLSTLLKQEIAVHNIRAGRNNPGLRPQHLHGLRLLASLCNGQLKNDQVGSTQVTYRSGSINAGTFEADTQTAGSVCLLFQAALPCLLYAKGPIELTLKGGTNADMAPQIDYMTMVLQPILQRHLGITFQCDIITRGYYPKGGGVVRIASTPMSCLPAFTMLNRGEITRVFGRSFAAGMLPIKVAHTMARVAQAVVQSALPGVVFKLDVVKEQNVVGTGSGIILVAETTTGCRLAGAALGKKGTPAETVGQNAAEELVNSIKQAGCVDQYLQDQLLIFMALANGKSQVRSGEVTLHTKTAVYICELMTKAKFDISLQEDGTNIITCDGIGLSNKNI